MAQGRKAIPTAPGTGVVLNNEALQQAGTALATLSAEAVQIRDMFHLDSMDPATLMAEIGLWMEHTGRAMYMVGARLVALRTVSPRGEWLPSIERLGISARTAQRFMGAALKCIDKDGKLREGMLQLSSSKVLELVALDDAQLDALGAGGLGQLALDFDELDRMSVAELRGKVRDLLQSTAAKDKLLGAKDKKINTLAEKLERPYKPSPDSEAATAEEQAWLDTMRDAITAAEQALREVADVYHQVVEQGGSEAMRTAARTNVEYLAQRLADVINEHGVEVSFEEMVTPTWIKKARAKKTS